MDLTQGSHRSIQSSHKSSQSSQKSYNSPESSERRSRRTGGPPDDLPSNSGHSRSDVPRSRQVAKVRSALSEKVQWDGQCSFFRQYKSAITGHLLQVGGAYFVNSSFHASYAKYAHNGEDYLESKDFKLMYPYISLLQPQLDRTYVYEIPVSSNKKDGERKFICKYEASQDEVITWIKFF